MKRWLGGIRITVSSQRHCRRFRLTMATLGCRGRVLGPSPLSIRLRLVMLNAVGFVSRIFSCGSCDYCTSWNVKSNGVISIVTTPIATHLDSRHLNRWRFLILTSVARGRSQRGTILSDSQVRRVIRVNNGVCYSGDYWCHSFGSGEVACIIRDSCREWGRDRLCAL